MAIRGQKFNLNLDAENFQFDVHDDDSHSQPALETFNVVKDVSEREPAAPPPPPKMTSKSGFPAHRPRKPLSAFKQRQQQASDAQRTVETDEKRPLEPSDRAIANHIGKKYGLDPEAKEKADISKENKRKLAHMSIEEIEEARAELLSGLNPALLQRLLQRANIDEDSKDQDWDNPPKPEGSPAAREPLTSVEPGRMISADAVQLKHAEAAGENTGEQTVLPAERTSNTHFPVPPRDPSSFTPLDPESDSFLHDLRVHYFPDTPHDPKSLTWLQDPTEDERTASAYAPTQYSYAPSDIRFDFAGRLIPPSEAETIPNSHGLHHHGDAPNSAGYTVPELAMLCRSTLPNQRCIAYQTLGRILYRLGRGDYGPKGTELSEGLWSCVEHERPLEVIMAEANRTAGHMSAKAYATEALWLWRRGGGGDRGVLKEGQQIVR